MRSSLPLGLALALSTGGCAMTIPDTVPYPRAAEHAGPRAGGSEDADPGASLCSRTSIAARSLSRAQAAGGWTLGALGVAMVGSGTIATVVNDQQPRLMAAAGLTLGGVALGIIAYNLFLRSAASARLAETTELTLLDRHDRRAWESCVRAKAAWEVSKTDPEGITRELAAQEERENRKLREEIEELKKKVRDDAPPAPPAPPAAPGEHPLMDPFGPRR